MNTTLFYEREEISARPLEFWVLNTEALPETQRNPTTNPCLVPPGDKDFAATLERE